MKNIVNKFKITDGDKFLLKDFDPAYADGFEKDDADEILSDLIAKTAELQATLLADNQYAVWIIFQAMDAGGKDSAIAHTMSGLNPQGCEVYSFKAPGPDDLAHDFYGERTRCCPAMAGLAYITARITKMC